MKVYVLTESYDYTGYDVKGVVDDEQKAIDWCNSLNPDDYYFMPYRDYYPFELNADLD